MATRKPLPELRAEFATELSTASRRMRTLFDGLVRERGLTLSRARALLYLSRHPDVNQTELAALLEIEHPTVVRLLDGLEKQGLIQRNAVEGDRRAKRITLTAAAHAQVDEIDGIIADLRGVMLHGIGRDQLHTAIEVLRQAGRNIDASIRGG